MRNRKPCRFFPSCISCELLENSSIKTQDSTRHTVKSEERLRAGTPGRGAQPSSFLLIPQADSGVSPPQEVLTPTPSLLRSLARQGVQQGCRLGTGTQSQVGGCCRQGNGQGKGRPRAHATCWDWGPVQPEPQPLRPHEVSARPSGLPAHPHHLHTRLSFQHRGRERGPVAARPAPAAASSLEFAKRMGKAWLPLSGLGSAVPVRGDGTAQCGGQQPCPSVR